jgi:hypothetical protein
MTFPANLDPRVEVVIGVPYYLLLLPLYWNPMSGDVILWHLMRPWHSWGQGTCFTLLMDMMCDMAYVFVELHFGMSGRLALFGFEAITASRSKVISRRVILAGRLNRAFSWKSVNIDVFSLNGLYGSRVKPTLPFMDTWKACFLVTIALPSIFRWRLAWTHLGLRVN